MRGASAVRVALSTEAALAVVTVNGEVDIATAPQVDAAFDQVLATGKAVLVDFSGVSFIDSTGLRLLIRAHRSLEQRDLGFAVIAEHPDVRRLLAISGLDQVFPVVVDEQAARDVLTR